MSPGLDERVLRQPAEEVRRVTCRAWWARDDPAQARQQGDAMRCGSVSPRGATESVMIRMERQCVEEGGDLYAGGKLGQAGG